MKNKISFATKLIFQVIKMVFWRNEEEREGLWTLFGTNCGESVIRFCFFWVTMVSTSMLKV